MSVASRDRGPTRSWLPAGRSPLPRGPTIACRDPIGAIGIARPWCGARSDGSNSAVGTALSMPRSIDMIVSPLAMRWRKISRCEGCAKVRSPSLAQSPDTSSRMSVKSWFSPEVSTVISARRPSGRSRVPSLSRLESPASSSNAFALARSNAVLSVANSGLKSGLCGSTVSPLSRARPKKITLLMSCRLMPIDRARRNRTSRIRPRQTGSFAVRFGYKAAKCALAHAPRIEP